MKNERKYTTQLQAGLGLTAETKTILDVWQNGMAISELNKKLLDSGIFPNISARRLRNIVSECFSPRYLVNNPYPANILKNLAGQVDNFQLNQLFFIYTARANRILYDFITDVYWHFYSIGRDSLNNDDARYFVEQANNQNKTTKYWSDSTIKRVSAYLTGCCADFGFLESGRKSTRKILPVNVGEIVITFLVYDLHFNGVNDNSIAYHEDWKLFGFDENDVMNELKRLALKKYLIFQSSGELTRISWAFQNWEEVINAITQG